MNGEQPSDATVTHLDSFRSRRQTEGPLFGSKDSRHEQATVIPFDIKRRANERIMDTIDALPEEQRNYVYNSLVRIRFGYGGGIRAVGASAREIVAYIETHPEPTLEELRQVIWGIDAPDES